MGSFFVFAFTAALNPTLLAVTTLLLSLPSPRRLLGGYLVGALAISFTCTRRPRSSYQMFCEYRPLIS